MAYLIGIDLGTTSIKCVLLDTTRGHIVATSSRPTPVQHPQPQWSEHDPEALWQATAANLRDINATGLPIAGLAISSMAEPGLPLDEANRPLAPIIAWYDRRSEAQAAWIEQQVPAADQFALTGQRVSPSFAVTKILWLRESQPEIFARMAAWMPAPAFLLQKLCGSTAVDYSLAARTLLFDQTQMEWSSTLLDRFNLRADCLPPVGPSGTFVGSVSPQAAQITGLPVGTPCLTGGHDHLCAALASGATQPGDVVDSTGTAQALLMLLPAFLPDPALSAGGFACSSYVLPGLFALKGGLKAAGGSIDWLARQLTPPGETPDFAGLEAAAQAGVGKRAGPIWLPHLIGSGTPEGDRFSRAALVGVQFEHDRGDLFRGLLESLAFWLRHNLEEMSIRTARPAESVSITGGVTRINLLSQLKADVLGKQIRVIRIPETAAAGAALVAGLGAGAFASPEEALACLAYPASLVEPDPVRATWYEAVYQQVYRPLYSSLSHANHALENLSRPAA